MPSERLVNARRILHDGGVPVPTMENDDDKVEVLDNFDDFEAGSLPPALTAPPSADGSIPHLPLAPSVPLPPATPENFVCLRGPCRFYLEIKSPSDVENRTLGYIPVQLSRYCRAVPGALLALDDDAVFECSDWDPREYDQPLEHRRGKYLEANPGCAEADAARKKQRDEALVRLSAEADAHEASERKKIKAAEKAASENINVNEWGGKDNG